MRRSHRFMALAGTATLALAACTPSGSGSPAASTAGSAGESAAESAAPSYEPASVKLQLQWLDQSQFSGYYAAEAQGYYKEVGLTVEFLPGGGTISPQEVGSQPNGPEFTIAWVPKVLQAREAGSDLVQIAQMAQRAPTLSVSWKNANITKPEDFKGKKVGVPGLNSMLHVMFQKWLLDNKVPLNQVTMIEAPFPQMNDMLKGGTIDAAVAIEPFRARIVSGNTGYRVADYVTDIQDNVLAAFWMAKADWAKANPQVVKAYREAYDEGLDWCVKNPEEAKQLQVKYLGFPSPVIPSYSSAINAKDLEIFEQAGRQVGMLRQPVDVSKLVWK